MEAVIIHIGRKSRKKERENSLKKNNDVGVNITCY
jgi:hypothetical protein